MKLLARLQIVLCLAVIASITLGCTSKQVPANYKQWLYSDASGLHDTIVRSGRTYEFTLLPSSYRKVTDGVDTRVVGLLRIRSSDSDLPDASFDGVRSLEEYASRVADLAFHVKSLTYMRIGDKVVDAIGSQHTQTQALSSTVSVYLVFPFEESDLQKAGSCEVSFTDEIYGEGRMTWSFRTAMLEGITEIAS